MKLTETQIENLYKFTRQHYVYHYDVQTELVDHLANDIEEIWLETPKLSFEQARDKSFKKFGIFGFMDVVEKKEWQMTKKYLKLVFKFIKEWFGLPKIVLTMVLFYGFYQLQKMEYAYNIYTGIFVALMILQILFMIVKGQKLKRKQKETGKKWMFEQIISVNGMANVFVMLFYFFDFPFTSSKDFLMMGDFKKFLSAFLITFVLILGHITLVVIPKKANQLLLETYPEYKMV
jgi:hypothetical protein|tara:strand:- start:324 stop:1022 length:699 start_codon:yes stop_codon:yes gene_type:complete